MRKDWSELVKACKSREGTLEEFAQANGVSKSALSYHITRSNQSARKREKFIPVLKSEPKTKPLAVVVEFPSGIKLTIQG